MSTTPSNPPIGSLDPKVVKDMLQEALQRLSNASTAITEANSKLDGALTLMINDHAPTELLNWHGGDVVRCDDSRLSIQTAIDELAPLAKEVAKAARSLAKMQEGAEVGLKKLYAEQRIAAAEERDRRESKQLGLHMGGKVIDMPKMSPPDDGPKTRKKGA